MVSKAVVSKSVVASKSVHPLSFNVSKDVFPTPRNSSQRVIPAWEVYFSRGGEKVSRLANSRKEALAIKRSVKDQRRKFLGMRAINLVELK